MICTKNKQNSRYAMTVGAKLCTASGISTGRCKDDFSTNKILSALFVLVCCCRGEEMVATHI